MLVVVSDTHGVDDHRLTGRTLSAVRDADVVAHAGDFTTAAVLDAFEAEASTLRAVHGNNDDDAVRSRLPDARTFRYGGVRFALTHTRRGGDTALALFGRERDADVVLYGHSHQPRFTEAGPVALLNPGSHADPRWNRPAHAELEAVDGASAQSGGPRLHGRLVSPGGEAFREFTVE